MTTFYIKQNDTAPAIRFALARGKDLEAADLTGATVVFNMKDQYGTLMVDAQPAVIEDAVNGVVRYDWQVGDTANSGNNYAEFEVRHGLGTIESFPNDTDIVVRIAPEIS